MRENQAPLLSVKAVSYTHLVKNIEELQNIIREQAALESLHISLE